MMINMFLAYKCANCHIGYLRLFFIIPLISCASIMGIAESPEVFPHPCPPIRLPSMAIGSENAP